MKTLPNLRRVLRLVLCALRHPSALAEHRGGVRCFSCRPLQQHVVRAKPAAEETPLFTEAQ